MPDIAITAIVHFSDIILETARKKLPAGRGMDRILALKRPSASRSVSL